MKPEQLRKKHNSASKYINKWLSIMSVCIAIGGVFAFGFVAFMANLFQATEGTYDPIWMVYMIPLMFCIATPITIFISKTIYKHINTLSEAMSEVANGKANVYIPTAGSNAFSSVYENFNKMAAEIGGIQSLRVELVDSFSHELKTPIASINGFAKLLLEEELSDEKKEKYLQIIIKESDRLATLAKNNLLLSKLDAQEIITDKHYYNLTKQIQEIAISMEVLWGAKNINLSAELEDVIYYGNNDLMACVFQNLISNAIKFTPKNGEINIDLKSIDNMIYITVTDSGIGMSEEVLKRVFERYYQGDNSHTIEGHGLGLSIVKRIVKMCDGEIKVTSKEGEGSIFTVILHN